MAVGPSSLRRREFKQCAVALPLVSFALHAQQSTTQIVGFLDVRSPEVMGDRLVAYIFRSRCRPKFELMINLKTAQALRSTCPTSRWMMSQWMSQLIAVSPLCGHRASVALEIGSGRNPSLSRRWVVDVEAGAPVSVLADLEAVEARINREIEQLRADLEQKTGLRQSVNRALASLTPREERVIRMRFGLCLVVSEASLAQLGS
jgi:hypothetical protein